MAILRSVPCVVILLAATASHGVSQVPAGPRGPVEFIGLERWTAPELLEAIQRIDPDQPLHACASTMKSQLGFADAAVTLHFDSYSREFLMSDEAVPYLVIVGVEDRARVRYIHVGTETIDLPEPWQALKSEAEEDFSTLVVAAEMFHSRHDLETLGQRTEFYGIEPTTLDPIWKRIEALAGEQDLLLAQEVLTNDASWSSRATAASVLVNFTEHDAAWHALMSAMIHPEVRVQGAAEAVLKGLIQSERGRPVRWDAARDTLLALLDGTNPFVFPIVLQVLAATEIEPTFGKQLLREAPDLLLAYVGAEHEVTRESAIDLLEIISGEDFGANPEAWSEWLNRPPDDS